MKEYDCKEHLAIIDSYLLQLNAEKDNPFVLKGGTALSLCYNLDRVSEDLDFDCPTTKGGNFFEIVDKYCKKNGYSFRVGKNTNFVQRAFVNYGEKGRPLKIEVSYRRPYIPKDSVRNINNIQVYTLSELARFKANAYISRDKIRDLYDVCYICANCFSDINKEAQNALRSALEYKDFDQFDYIVATQNDPLIDTDKLEDMFLESFDKLGLLAHEKNIEINEEKYDSIEVEEQKQINFNDDFCL